ncbi:phage antirepressor KilAC domain-containing protein [Pseudochelatococcus sp. B33]
MAVPANSTRAPVAHHAPVPDPRALPEIYTIRIHLDNLAPHMRDGEMHVFSTVEPFKKGDIVALWRRPETVAPGELQAAAYRLTHDLPADTKLGDQTYARTPADFLIYVESTNPRERFAYRTSELVAIHKWMGKLHPKQETYKLQMQEREANAEPARATQSELSLLAPAADGPLTMSSREIAELTGKEHKHVIRDIQVMLTAVMPGWEKDGPKLGHQGIAITYDNRGYVSEIRLPKDLTITLVAGYDANLRLKIIRRWMELEGAAKKPAAPEFPIPQTFAEALMLAANQAAQIEHQKGAIAEMKPKAEFHDDVASAVNAQTFMDIAKAFGTGRTRFTRWLRARSFVMENLRPYQQYIDAGYFRVVEKKRKDPETGEKFVYVQTLVTGKGVTYLQKKWAEDHKDAA